MLAYTMLLSMPDFGETVDEHLIKQQAKAEVLGGGEGEKEKE